MSLASSLPLYLAVAGALTTTVRFLLPVPWGWAACVGFIAWPGFAWMLPGRMAFERREPTCQGVLVEGASHPFWFQLALGAAFAAGFGLLEASPAPARAPTPSAKAKRINAKRSKTCCGSPASR